MAASWLAGLWKSLWAPAPGTPEARLEEKRVGALLDKELAQPPGQRDEERVRQLRMEHTKLLLGNYQVEERQLEVRAGKWECPGASAGPTSDCCPASDWVRQRTAACYRAVQDYRLQLIAQPTLRLNLPEALQQQPPWLDLCSWCANRLQKNELIEESCRVHAKHSTHIPRADGVEGAPAAAAASGGEAGATAAAADMPAREAQQQQQCGGAQAQLQQHPEHADNRRKQLATMPLGSHSPELLALVKPRRERRQPGAAAGVPSAPPVEQLETLQAILQQVGPPACYRVQRQQPSLQQSGHRRVGLHILLLQQNIHSHATSYVQGIRVGEWWKDRLDCRQWGAHFPHVAGIAGQSNVGAQSVVLSGG
ncbi:hypothetical protein COHA_010749 [Chlorella ohadii]|uniref:YDG domain-containing protein n=1 Tax=Chlorella ohadii TaxID=2649997 RepID=A0AAD5DH50_9CHLO|nr:hypothetical protein COHA_010749 [Chlorella ohadii]